MEAHHILVKTGAMVDASVVETPLRPKGKVNYQMTQDRTDQKEITLNKDYPDSVDKQAAWLKKGDSYHYGYKKHHLCDDQGLVLGVLTTKAIRNEIANLQQGLVPADLPPDISLKSDKGYQSAKNDALLKQRKLKNRILKKAYKNKPLTQREKRFNKLVGKAIFKVECTFGSIKRWFGVAR